VITGINQLRARFRAIGKTEVPLRAWQLDTVAGAKARVHRQTGFLGRAIMVGHVDKDSAQVVVNAPYAAAEELGIKGGKVIVPKRAKVLAWPSAGGARLSGRARTKGGKPTGPTVFAMKVTMKPRKGHPYLMPAALEAVRKRGIDAIVKLWNSAA
jgi:hypothetical protein